MKFGILLLVLISSLAVAKVGGNPYPASNAPKIAKGNFSTGSVGISGSMPPIVPEVWRIAEEEPDAEAQFIAMTESSNTGARMYGLWGLLIIGSPNYAYHRDIVTAEGGEVSNWGGCVVSTSTVSEVVSNLERWTTYGAAHERYMEVKLKRIRGRSDAYKAYHSLINRLKIYLGIKSKVSPAW